MAESDALNDPGDLSLMDSMVIDSDRRAFIKCPTRRAQDFYETTMLDFKLCQNEVESPVYGKVMALAEQAMSLGREDCETDEGLGSPCCLSDSDSETESSAIRADEGEEP